MSAGTPIFSTGIDAAHIASANKYLAICGQQDCNVAREVEVARPRGVEPLFPE